MRNFLTLMFVLTLCGSSLSAQYIGLRGGLNITELTVESNGTSFSFDEQTNLMLGLYFDLPVGSDKLLLSPEVSYLVRGYDIGVINSTFETKFNYVDLGLLVKLMIIDGDALGLYVGGGPIAAFAINGTIESSAGTEDIEFDGTETIDRLNLNAGAVAGLTFGRKLFVEARYTWSLSPLEDPDDPINVNESKWTTLGINAGLRFPLGN